MPYTLYFKDGPLTFAVHDKKIEAAGYDIESESIAAALTGEISQQGLFLMAAQSLLSEIGEKKFDEQYANLESKLDVHKAGKAVWIQKDIGGGIRLLPKSWDLYVLYQTVKDNLLSTPGLHSPGVLRELAKAKNERLQNAIAKNPNTSQQTLKELANSPYFEVILEVAQHPSTPMELLDGLLSRWDNLPRLQQAIIRNPNAPRNLLFQFSNDLNLAVRRVVAENTNDAEIMTLLARDTEYSVRLALTRNPQLSKELIRFLSQDIDQHVRNGARKKLTALERAVAGLHDLRGRVLKVSAPTPKDELEV